MKYPVTFHIGFIQESEQRVDEINGRLKEDGVDVPPSRQHGSWTFYFLAPEGLRSKFCAEPLPKPLSLRWPFRLLYQAANWAVNYLDNPDTRS